MNPLRCKLLTLRNFELHKRKRPTFLVDLFFGGGAEGTRTLDLRRDRPAF